MANCAELPSRCRFTIEEIVHPEAQAVARQYLCTICHCILEKPVQTACDHLFCEDCIRPLLACPTCRTDLGAGGWRPLHECNKVLFRMMHDLKVWCPYHAQSRYTVPGREVAREEAPLGTGALCDVQEGGEAEPPAPKRKRARRSKLAAATCEWEGSYTDLLASHLHQCAHHWLPCPAGCGELVQRRDLATHGQVCARKVEACTICGEQVEPGSMEAHRAEKAELHVRVLEAKCSKLESREASDRQALREALARVGGALEKVETGRANLVTKQDLTMRCQQLSTELKYFFRRNCDKLAHRERICWQPGKWKELQRESPKGVCIVSPEFTISGFGPCVLHFFPSGDDVAHPGMATVELCAPEQRVEVSGKLFCGPWEKSFNKTVFTGTGSWRWTGPSIPVEDGDVKIYVEISAVVHFL